MYKKILMALVPCVLCGGAWAADEMEKDFVNPPDSARPGVYWYFMDGNLDRELLEKHFENYGAKLIAAAGLPAPGATGGLQAMHLDSWEMNAQNWNPGLPGEFRRRRGYDFTPFLATFSGRVVGDRAASERALWDLRLTIHELILENYVGHLRTLAHRHKLKLSIEPHGYPPSASPRLMDFPACDAEVKRLAQSLWGQPPYPAERKVGRGRGVLDSGAAELIANKPAPDLKKDNDSVYPGYATTAAAPDQVNFPEASPLLTLDGPWQVEVTGTIRAGENHLEIEVANRWSNRQLSDTQPPDKDARTLKWDKGMLGCKEYKTGSCTFSTGPALGQLLPSGLIGPVQLLTQRPESVK